VSYPTCAFCGAEDFPGVGMRHRLDCPRNPRNRKVATPPPPYRSPETAEEIRRRWHEQDEMTPFDYDDDGGARA
jgi:hypothetical protein